MAHTFVRWLRTGLAAALGDQPQSTGSGRRATVSLGVVVAAGTDSQVASVDLSVLGPGDVSGIDPRQLIRSHPAPGTNDFEPTFHAHVELDRPDLPWLFTPFGPNTGDDLRPWICLVVVERGEHVELRPGPPPVLVVTGDEVGELPDLADAPRWAHVQIAGAADRPVREIAEQEQERILSRLVCPRTLSARTAYLACVVPTFAIGALTGLGRAPSQTTGLDAWSPGDTTVELPVYHSWEFATGDDGDFRSLVLRLEAKAAPEGVGTRPLDVSRPAFGLADRAAADPVDLGGILRVDPPASAPADAVLAAELSPVLNATGALGPPVYGRWHAAATGVAGAGAALSGWVDELNLDVRHRVAAGLGTTVVQERQEDLMAAIWEQLGEILLANQLLRQGQLAISASERIVARHLDPLPDATFLGLVGPASARTRVGTGRTLRGAVARSCLPVLVLSGAFRRIARVNGPIQRRLARLTTAGFPDKPPAPAIDLDALVTEMASGALSARAPALPNGAVALPARAARGWRAGHPPRRPPFDEGDVEGPLSELAHALATLSRRAVRRACAPLDIGATAAATRAALEPDVAIAARVRDRVRVPTSSRVVLSRRLDPIMAAPEIPTPMMGPLQELGQPWLLPGIEAMPSNSATIAEPNSELIEGYMVGLNHEMGRELLWRGFPTDQRGTVFSRFWDRRGAVATTSDPVPERDIPDIHTWDPAGALGSHLDAGGKQGPVVLIVRGDLIRRYPLATVFLRRGRWVRDTAGAIVFDGDLATREPVPVQRDSDWRSEALFPQFTGRSGADVAFYGFARSQEDVRGIEPADATARSRDDQAGWYVVFQEQPTEPRFGPPPAGGAAAPLPQDSDQLAAALLREPFRLFVHASDLVTP
jgi:hypothetical protein